MDAPTSMNRAHPAFESTVKAVLASAIAEGSSATEWLRMDEHGTWELQTRDFVETKYDVGLGMGMTHEQIVEAIGVKLVCMALQAMIHVAQKDEAKVIRQLGSIAQVWHDPQTGTYWGVSADFKHPPSAVSAGAGVYLGQAGGKWLTSDRGARELVTSWWKGRRKPAPGKIVAV